MKQNKFNFLEILDLNMNIRNTTKITDYEKIHNEIFVGIFRLAWLLGT